MPRTGHRLVNGAIDEAVVFSRALTRERNKRGDDRWVNLAAEEAAKLTHLG